MGRKEAREIALHLIFELSFKQFSDEELLSDRLEKSVMDSLAGGEPMIRRDVIEAAGKKPGILFPIFTNGTFMDEQYFELLDRCRNLIPIMSIEGDKENTDARRGTGIYDQLITNMEELHR